MDMACFSKVCYHIKCHLPAISDATVVPSSEFRTPIISLLPMGRELKTYRRCMASDDMIFISFMKINLIQKPLATDRRIDS
jgi:hypothetical protein